jgi:hypothetical protein
VRPAPQKIQEQTQEQGEKHASEQNQSLVKEARLLLSSYSALLQIQGLLGHTPVFGQLFALNVADLLQQLLYTIVSLHRSPPCRHNAPHPPLGVVSNETLPGNQTRCDTKPSGMKARSAEMGAYGC